MKKLICAILALLTALTLVACAAVGDVSTDTSSSDAVSENVESSSGESSEPADVSDASEISEDSETSEISEVSDADVSTVSEVSEDEGEKPDDSIARSNIAKGKFYTVEGGNARTDEYGDYNKSKGNRGKLTDGTIPDKGERNTICGYYGANDYTITLDLDGEGWIYGACIGFFGGNWDVEKPSKITVCYSALVDGKYVELGKAAMSGAKDVGEWSYGEFKLEHKPVKATTLRVSIHIDGNTNLWMSELTADGYMIPESAKESQIVKVYIETNGQKIIKDDYITCSIKIVDPSGTYETLEQNNATIKVRGNSTSAGNKKPYNVKFEKKQDVLGMGKCKKWYLLANMYDKSLMRDKLAYDFAADTGLAYTQQSTFCDVYLNGQYVGDYQICESIGVGDTRVDIDTTGNEFLLEYEPWPQYSNPECFETESCHILLGFNDPETPTAEQLAWIKDFTLKAETALRSGDKNEIAKYWDIDSFVNDYIVHEYFKCVDAQTSSTRYYIKGNKIYGGPVWDFDLSSGNANPNYYTSYYNDGDSTTGWWCRALWYKYFFRTDWFEKMCIERYKELQPIIENLFMANELGECKIEALLDEFGESFIANSKIWPVTSKDVEYERFPLTTYDEGINFLRSWLYRRNEWIKQQWGIE